MRIERIHIDGYGIFRDLSLDELSPKAATILGPNESGKTTLLSFIRTILFGFVDRRSAENPYEPLRGGRHGGRIFLADSRNETYVVERFAGPRGGTLTLTLPGGAPGAARELADLLGHASRDLFRNVFAFSLAELQTLETLRNEDVRTRIYGAGLGAGRLGLPEIEKRIQKDREKLYREGGSAQTIAGLTGQADEIRAKLRHLSGQVTEHDRLRSELEGLRRDIEAKQEARRSRQAQAVHISNLLSARDDWTELNSAQERLGELPKISQLPADGIARLERHLQQRDDLEDRARELANDIARAQEEIDRIEVDEAILQRAADIEGLQRGLDRYESARDDLPRRQSELEADLDGLRGGLRDLGPDWDEERVNTFDTSLPAREAVREYGERLRTSATVIHDTDRDAERAKADLREASSEHARLKEELQELGQPPERDQKVLDSQRRKLRELRSLLSDGATNQQRLEHLEERKADLESRIDWFERQKAQKAAALPGWPAAAASLVGGAVAAWLALQADWVAAVVIAVAGLGLGLGYARLRSSLRRQAQLDIVDAELTAVVGQLDTVRTEAATTDSLVKDGANSMERLAEELRFDETPDTRDLDTADDALEEDLEALKRWEAASRRVKEAAQRAEGLEEKVQEAETAANKAQNQAREAKDAWGASLEKRGIDLAMNPDTCLELLSRVDGLREKVKAIDGLRTRMGSIGKAMSDFEGRANPVRQACGLKDKDRGGFPGAVDELIEASAVARQNSERVQQLRQEIEAAAHRKKAFEKRAEEVATVISELLSEGGAADQEDFRRRAEVFTEREQQLRAVRDRRKNLQRIAGREEALKSFIRELEDADPEQLQQEKLEAGEAVARIEADLKAMEQQQGQLMEQIRQLEAEEESSDLRLRLSVLREQINSEAQEWSVLTLARALLEETRLKYERERQPAVIQEAQTFFGSFTNGRYERIFSLPGENRIEVEDRAGRRKQIADLSRGTAEQLYLALRFGLVREFARRVEPLPVVMDDILVNFDPDRAREACRAIGELSKKQQVLLFTCHPETVERVRSAIRGCDIIELPEPV